MKLRNKVEEPTAAGTWLTDIRVLEVENEPLDQLKVAMEKLVERLKPQSEATEWNKSRWPSIDMDA